MALFIGYAINHKQVNLSVQKKAVGFYQLLLLLSIKK
jgi:hypothetical protein